MDRRIFLLSLLAACGCGQNDVPRKEADASSVASKAVESPPASGPELATEQVRTKISRVSVLSFGDRPNTADTLMAAAPGHFRARLTELGYIEGKTIVVEEKFANGDPQRLTQLARQIVESNPDVIVAFAAAATAAARRATSTIPIVMVHAGNPVGSGLVSSLAHPGGNVTGTTSMVPDLGAKQVELLRELLPGLAKLGLLVNPTNAGVSPMLANVTETARRFNISVVVAEVTRVEDFDRALALLHEARLDALLVAIEPLIVLNRARVLEFAAASRLPVSYDVGSGIVRQGGLISYGPVLLPITRLPPTTSTRSLKAPNPAIFQFISPLNSRSPSTLRPRRSLA